MGYFTWTLANKKIETNANGDYRPGCKLKYGGRGVVVCPNDTHIIEEHYDGYGNFAGNDIYDLVVDWNKPYLEKIFESIERREGSKHWGAMLKPVAIAYMNDDKKALKTAIAFVAKEQPYLKEDWKRNIGITIACDDDCMRALPFPIKIVDNKRIKKYAELGVSLSCQ